MNLLKLLRKFEKREKVLALLEIFSTGTIALYTYTGKNTVDRKYVRDFTSLIEVESWLKGQDVPDGVPEVTTLE